MMTKTEFCKMVIKKYIDDFDGPVGIDDLEGFLAYLKEKAVVNPKIISNFRKWNTDPNLYIVQFKFEINTTEQELVDIASSSCRKNKADLCVANDKNVMKVAKSHNSLFVKPDGSFIRVNGKDNIASNILRLANEYMDGKSL